VTIDAEWARQELTAFLALTAITYEQSAYSGRIRVRIGGKDQILSAAVVVEQIVDRVLPDWRITITPQYSAIDRWDVLVEAAKRSLTTIDRQDEVREKLGDGAPQLDASNLHPWIWEGARSLWQSGHFREAVASAAIKLNAETQNLVQRRDKSEGALFLEAFSNDPPKPGAARLRIVPDDGSDTFRSIHRGARDFANGLYAAIRNPISHTLGELPEVEALEQLAAFSVLARWVSRSDLILST
jgi:hypothetical protein